MHIIFYSNEWHLIEALLEYLPNGTTLLSKSVGEKILGRYRIQDNKLEKDQEESEAPILTPISKTK